MNYRDLFICGFAHVQASFDFRTHSRTVKQFTETGF